MTERAHDDPLDALKAELASVAPSPEFAARVCRRIAGEMDQLSEELAAVAPSPEFAARVRQGIEAAADDRAKSWFSGWRWLVPTAAGASVVIAVFVLSRPRSETPTPVTATAPVAIANPVAAAVPPNVSRPAALGSSKFEVRSTKFRPVGVAAVPGDVEVITDQPAILRALWARVGTGAPLTEVSATVAPDTVPEIVVAPIEVSPIVVKPLGDPPPLPGALPIVR